MYMCVCGSKHNVYFNDYEYMIDSTLMINR